MADQVRNEEPSVEELFRQYAASRQLPLRDQLIGRHAYLVEVVARKFAGLGESPEDLVQEGTLGLINAVDMFDVNRGVKFATYATHLIAGQIQHYLRDKGKLIRQPAWVQELLAKITRVTEALTQELGRAPSHAEVAERLNLTEEAVAELLKARERTKVTSLDAQAEADGDTGATISPEKIRSAHLVSLQLPIEDKIMLQEAIDKLKDLERKVVRYFFYYDLNQTEIARKLGISVNYASYLLRGSLGKLHAAFEHQAQAEQQAEPQAVPAVARGRRPLAAPVVRATDSASGLPGEAYLRERLSLEAERASRYPQQFSLLLVQLDTRRGMVVPPALTAAVGALLRRSSRAVDVVTALSPAGCFGLLLPHTGKETRVLAERLLTRISSTDWSSACPAQPCWTASLGCALFPQDGSTDQAILAAAQKAVQDSQQAGGNCLTAAPPAPRTRSAAALSR